MKKFAQPLAAIGGGLLLTAAFEPYNIWFLGWFALVPFLWAALKAERPRNAAFLGFLFGVTHYLTSIPWIRSVVIEYSALPIPVPALLLLLLCCYLALFSAAVAWGARYLWGKSHKFALLLAPVFWVGFEFLRSFLLGGFPWDPLGNSQVYFLPALQVADIGGVYLVSFVLAFFSAGVASLILADRPYKLSSLYVPGIAAILTIFALIYGFLVIAAQPDDEEKFQVAIVQDDLDNAGRIAADQMELYNYYVDSAMAAAERGADVVMWGEGALLFLDMFGDSEDGTPGGFTEQHVLSLPRDGNFWLIMGSNDYVGEGDMLYNVALTAGPDNDSKADGRYAKTYLVPFGEFVPFQPLFFWLDKIVPEISDFAAGERPNTMPLLDGRVGVPVCFEVIFPGLVRQFTVDGATVLATISNDAWFGHEGAANRQHFAHAIVRAVENRRYLLRCAVSGVSGIIDPAGRVQIRSNTYERVVLDGEAAMREGYSLYATWGDVFAWLCLLLAIGAPLWVRYTRSRTAPAGPQPNPKKE